MLDGIFSDLGLFWRGFSKLGLVLVGFSHLRDFLRFLACFGEDFLNLGFWLSPGLGEDFLNLGWFWWDFLRFLSCFGEDFLNLSF